MQYGIKLGGQLIAVVVAFSWALLAPRSAAATVGGSRTFVGAGVNLGLDSSEERPRHAPVLGVEGSLVHFAEFAWAGVYADTLYSFGEHNVRMTLGPELGVGPFGIDGGYALALGRGGVQSGVSFRPMLTLAYVTLYYRYEQLDGPSGSLNEVGVLLKGFKGFKGW